MSDSKELIELHGNVARRFKQYESILLGEYPPYSVVNELRYALRAVMVILATEEGQSIEIDADDDAYKDNPKERAYHALICAYHDLFDSAYLELVHHMHSFSKKYTQASIQVLGEKRAELFDFLEEVGNIVVESRGEGLKRADLYENGLYDKYFDQLIAFKKEIDRDALPEIISVHLKLEQEIRIKDEQTY